MLLHKVVLVLGSAGLAAAAPLQDMLQVHQTGMDVALSCYLSKKKILTIPRLYVCDYFTGS